MQNNFTQLKAGDVAITRKDILHEQGGLCAICSCKITPDTGISLDHQHKRVADEVGIDGAGLIRGVLCRACNVWEGKVWNSSGRYHQTKTVQSRIELLQNLIKYYEKGTYNLVHPSEKPREKKVSKRNYNKLKKIYDLKRKFPEYPKSGKLTKGLRALFEQYDIEPYN